MWSRLGKAAQEVILSFWFSCAWFGLVVVFWVLWLVFCIFWVGLGMVKPRDREKQSGSVSNLSHFTMFLLSGFSAWVTQPSINAVNAVPVPG